ncbi:hypothetical protein CC1G_08189 [Coprinopsis cinerea okayama7|uniref:Uncharacterized protein n=1 Tax=Coprinopsis cinerea (strain Okayama-7 / 130 / ATCC MYA-4618 / FGSC 9003) TaxID=240176 RepID=A8P7A9_COPC7|nr:hypothetical protein CC1G_08189 [Coprinopsis cinerea okayama7\|eukprot:XP_001839322.2 hypothetical protein CC1G_08189 [Coprinopsis cinerea okayama7\
MVKRQNNRTALHMSCLQGQQTAHEVEPPGPRKNFDPPARLESQNVPQRPENPPPQHVVFGDDIMMGAMEQMNSSG